MARSRTADEWRKFAHTRLRYAANGWHAPFGASPPFCAGGESIGFVVGKARAQDVSRGGILIRHLPGLTRQSMRARWLAEIYRVVRAAECQHAPPDQARW
jgi:hypothetical protein